jgi:hypothetical protein
MAIRSSRLKAREVREVMRLVGEVREKGRDPVAWREHAGTRLAELTGASLAMSVQARFTRLGPSIMMLANVGWESDSQKQIYYDWLKSPGFITDPYMLAIRVHGNATYFGERRQFVEDRGWYRSEQVSEIRRSGNVDDNIISSVVLPDGSVDQFSLQRPWGAKPFTRHESVLLSIFHRELQRIWIPAAHRHAPVNRLPDYLRRTFDKLINGRSEKEAAEDLGVKPSTLHCYVKELYVRLGVQRRGELFTRFGEYDFAPRLGPPVELRDSDPQAGQMMPATAMG